MAPNLVRLTGWSDAFFGEAALLALVWSAVMPLPLSAAGAAAPSAAEGYGSRLEMALNRGDANDLTYLTGPDLSGTVQRRYDRFATNFPEALWRVEAMDPLADGRSRLRVVVSGTGTADGQNYRLEASQTLAVRIEAGVMVEEDVLEEQTLLRSGTAELPITVQIPDAVLTGSRYDIDVIFEEPLGQAVAAGGLIELTRISVGAAEPLGSARPPRGWWLVQTGAGAATIRRSVLGCDAGSPGWCCHRNQAGAGVDTNAEITRY